MINESFSGVLPGQSQEFRRIERKFPVEPGRLDILAAWLGHACTPATDFPVSQVTSVYFDTPDWDGYFESVDGDAEKRKVRLRWYDELPETSEVTAFIESKEKLGSETWKRRVPLKVDAAVLREGAFEQLLPPGSRDIVLANIGVFDGSELQPAVVVTYRRHRFTERSSGLHLALDTEVRAWAAGTGRRARTVNVGGAVLEIKGSSLELPRWFSPLRRFVSVWSSNSKYAMAVDALSRDLSLVGR